MRIEKTHGQVLDVTLEPADQPAPCPFCGSGLVTLEHTHTASYWLECEGCGAEMHDIGNIGKSDSKPAHLASVRRVLKAWKRRANG